MIRRTDTGPSLDGSAANESVMLEEALLAAYAPSDLSEERHSKIIDAALADPLAPASPEELRDAEALRLALDGLGEHPNAALASALVSAWAPAPPPPALRSIPAAVRRFESARTSKTLRLALGLGSASLAVAAATALVLRNGTPPEIPHSSVGFYEARSTATLFNEQFKRGEASRRVDRIAAVRVRELRENRFAMWGIK